jgi:hypothetical protein
MPGKTIAQKLFLKPSNSFCVLNAPAGFLKSLKDLPSGVKPTQALKPGADMILAFATSLAQFKKLLPEVKSTLGPDGILWIGYPKGTSKIKTDINRDIIAAAAKKTGLQAVSLFAIDETWSALRVKRV